MGYEYDLYLIEHRENDEDHKNHIQLAPKTRKTVEDILERIKNKLDETE